MLSRTIHDSPLVIGPLRSFATWALRVRGWQVEGRLPDAPRFVLVAAPHTSSLDLPIMLAVGLHFRVRLHWLGSSLYFRWPASSLLRWLGGIPVGGASSGGPLDQATELMASVDEIAVGISPEGSRHRVQRWRTGFYHLALDATVPIVLGFIDYRRRVTGVGPSFTPTGDIEADLESVRAFYADIRGRHPERESEIVVEASRRRPSESHR